MTSSSQTSVLLCRGLVLALALQSLTLLSYSSDLGSPPPRALSEKIRASSATGHVSAQVRDGALSDQPHQRATSGRASSAKSPLTLEVYTRCLAQELGLDEALALSVMMQESHPVDPYRTGLRGSRGPLQIKPIALEEVGLSRDAEQLPFLVYGGLLYLKKMMTHFPDLPTALAAYNMGPVRLKQRAYRPYPSTRRYVEQILARQARIRSATFRPRPVLHYQLSEKELGAFPDREGYPTECHLRPGVVETSAGAGAASAA